MQPKLMDRLIEALERTKEGLEEQARRARSAGRQGQQDGDEGDRALADHLQDMAWSVGSADNDLLMQVQSALDRVARGEFGMCTACGEAIALKRLQAAPWVERCIACQEHAERGVA